MYLRSLLEPGSSAKTFLQASPFLGLPSFTESPGWDRAQCKLSLAYPSLTTEQVMLQSHLYLEEQVGSPIPNLIKLTLYTSWLS